MTTSRCPACDHERPGHYDGCDYDRTLLGASEQLARAWGDLKQQVVAKRHTLWIVAFAWLVLLGVAIITTALR
jgi:hypothetical protein